MKRLVILIMLGLGAQQSILASEVLLDREFVLSLIDRLSAENKARILKVADCLYLNRDCDKQTRALIYKAQTGRLDRSFFDDQVNALYLDFKAKLDLFDPVRAKVEFAHLNIEPESLSDLYSDNDIAANIYAKYVLADDEFAEISDLLTGDNLNMLKLRKVFSVDPAAANEIEKARAEVLIRKGFTVAAGSAAESPRVGVWRTYLGL